MRRSFLLQLSVLLLVGTAAGVHADNSNKSGQSPVRPPADSTTPAPPAGTNPEVTVTGKVPHGEQVLPTLPPDQFTDCMRGLGSVDNIDMRFVGICASRLNMEMHIVIDACFNADGKGALPRVIQACTESLDRKIFEGSDRFYLFANRADAYFALGDKERALDDYNQAVKLAPNNAKLYYNRGVFHAAQADGEAAFRDLNTALSINPKFVAALRERAKLYLTQDNFSGALADYSEAVRVQPKTAALWSERGYLYLRQRDYDSAVKDEAEAIRLDPKLARAYFLRGAAFGDLGNSSNAVSDIVTAVGLDPSLDRYVSTKGKTASIALPPF